MKKTSPTSPAAADMPSSYEAALAELDTLVKRMESGQLPLDEMLTQHQRGVDLLAYCQEKLQALDQQIQVFEAGQRKPLDLSTGQA